MVYGQIKEGKVITESGIKGEQKVQEYIFHKVINYKFRTRVSW
jgi:hypothetical protein